MLMRTIHDLPRAVFPALSSFALAWALAACGGGDTGAGGGATVTISGIIHTTAVTPPAIHQCVGEAAPCLGRSSSQCDGSAGCFMLGTCNGTATPCFEILDQVGCELQEGCLWGTNQCSGTESACDTIHGSIACGDQQGCTWVPGCIGTAWTCDMFTDNIHCAEQPGCMWQ
jgi:hypothetical protein